MDETSLTVVGIGSPFGDDQAGWAVIERLAAWDPPLQAEFVQSKAPAVDLLQIIGDAKRVVLVDAVAADLPVGSVHRWAGEDITRVSSAVSTHGFDIGQVLALGSRLGLIPQDVVLYGIAVEPAACRPTQPDISARVAGAIEIAAARIVADIHGATAVPLRPVDDSSGHTSWHASFNGSGD